MNEKNKTNNITNVENFNDFLNKADFSLIKRYLLSGSLYLLIDDFVTEMTSLIAIKLYNSFSSLSLTFLFLLYPFNISIHPERGSFRFIIPYEQVIARSLIV